MLLRDTSFAIGLPPWDSGQLLYRPSTPQHLSREARAHSPEWARVTVNDEDEESSDGDLSTQRSRIMEPLHTGTLIQQCKRTTVRSTNKVRRGQILVVPPTEDTPGQISSCTVQNAVK